MLWAMEDSSANADSSSRSPGREPSERIWTDWPCCAHCGRPRLTVCPICGAAGERFPLAEFLAPAAPVRRSRGGAPEPPERDDAAVEILLVCPQCDEAFAPRFYRRCPQCGHDEGTGIDLRPPDIEPLSDTILLVICGLVAGVVAMMLYLRWLFP